MRGVGERIEAVIWFSDLQGFTHITDSDAGPVCAWEPSVGGEPYFVFAREPIRIRMGSSPPATRHLFDGLRGETSIAELCRREGIAESMYYSWSKE
jgi:hypothetical protein